MYICIQNPNGFHFGIPIFHLGKKKQMDQRPDSLFNEDIYLIPLSVRRAEKKWPGTMHSLDIRGFFQMNVLVLSDYGITDLEMT